MDQGLYIREPLSDSELFDQNIKQDLVFVKFALSYKKALSGNHGTWRGSIEEVKLKWKIVIYKNILSRHPLFIERRTIII